MLVCLQCQFENPNANNFCQRCGTSLTHKTCPNCEVQVPLEAEKCQNCGVSTGAIWWAVIFNLGEHPALFVEQKATQAVEIAEPSTSSPSTTTDTSSELLPTPPLDEAPLTSEAAEDLTLPLDTVAPSSREKSASKVGYLDAQQRYQLLEPPMTQSDSSGVTLPDTTLKVRVLDCQPLQRTLLETLVDRQVEEGLQGTQEAPAMNLESWKNSSIPAIAQPYLALKAIYKTTLPSVHDAWKQDETSIVLLEDRSQWQLLTDLWGEREIPSLQILYWLDEMARLWASLEPWQCRQSLLVPGNLRVDEDQTLSLTLLYPEVPEVPLTLKDLGQVWQQLFNQSQRTQFSDLDQLFRRLSAGEIETVEALRQQVAAIAHNPALEPPTSSSPTLNEALSYSSMEGDDLPTVILPMQLLSLDDAGSTDIGRQRNHNEDYFGISTQQSKQETPGGGSVQARGLYILCDGMGGHAAGEVASAMAVDTLKQYFSEQWQDKLPDEKNIREGVRLANKAIYDVNLQNSSSGSGRMGTTLVMAFVQGTEVAIAHVGDSRLYRYSRKRGLEQITVDHEVGQREIQRGVEPEVAYSRPDAYQLTQALGPRDENFVKPDVQFIELNEDTLLILASDGLTDNDLLETHWETYLAPLISSRANLEQGLQQLIDFANQHNGHDNITGILIRAKVRPNLDQQQPL